MSSDHQGGPFVVYTLTRTRTQPHVYRLVSQRTGTVYRVLWSLENEQGVFVTPEDGLTGLHFYWDMVVTVEVLPVGE